MVKIPGFVFFLDAFSFADHTQTGVDNLHNNAKSWFIDGIMSSLFHKKSSFDGTCSYFGPGSCPFSSKDAYASDSMGGIERDASGNVVSATAVRVDWILAADWDARLGQLVALRL